MTRLTILIFDLDEKTSLAVSTLGWSISISQGDNDSVIDNINSFAICVFLLI